MEDRPVDADVLVAGGGPAGAAAAIACAVARTSCRAVRAGAGWPRAAGRDVASRGRASAGQLGVADRLAPVVGARHAGIWIEWGGPRRFEAFGGDASGPWSGFQVWRADFDALLLARAGEAGVDVRQPCAVTGPPIARGSDPTGADDGGTDRRAGRRRRHGHDALAWARLGGGSGAAGFAAPRSEKGLAAGDAIG